MNTFQLSNPTELFESEELESWETKDFDDVLPLLEVTEQENDLIWNIKSGWSVDRFH